MSSNIERIDGSGEFRERIIVSCEDFIAKIKAGIDEDVRRVKAELQQIQDRYDRDLRNAMRELAKARRSKL